MKERILLFLSHLGIGQNKFEAMCGIANGTINNMKDNMTVKTLLKVSNTFTELNIHWLLTGNGDMLKVPLHQENSGIVTGANLSNDRNITTSNNPEYVQYKLDAALKEIELLKERIKDKEYIIEMLKNKNN